MAGRGVDRAEKIDKTEGTFRPIAGLRPILKGNISCRNWRPMICLKDSVCR